MIKNRLGKGIGALIPDSMIIEHVNHDKQKLIEIDPKLIKTNPYQPRLSFDENSLNDLKQSIKENGLIQPIAVRKVENYYELIAGERRLRSVLDLGYEKIPAFILDISTKEEMLEIALIENVQREKLNVIELALSYKRLIDECSLTIEKVAQKIGKDRSTINNIIRLLKLPKEIQDSIVNQKISMGHARALLSISDKSEQLSLAEKAIRHDYSVRKIENIIKELQEDKRTEKLSKSETKSNANGFHNKIENSIRQNLGTHVKIKPKQKGGIIEVEYYTDDDLLRISDLLQKKS